MANAKGRIVWVQNVSNAKIHHLFVLSRVQIDIYMDVEPKIGKIVVFPPPKSSILIGFSMK